MLIKVAHLNKDVSMPFYGNQRFDLFQLYLNKLITALPVRRWQVFILFSS